MRFVIPAKAGIQWIPASAGMTHPEMILLRRIGFAALFALALLVGQQAVVLHDLKHAAEHREGGTPSEKNCDTH